MSFSPAVFAHGGLIVDALVMTFGDMMVCRNYFVERAWISRLLSDSQLVAQDRRLGSDSLSVARLDEMVF